MHTSMSANIHTHRHRFISVQFLPVLSPLAVGEPFPCLEGKPYFKVSSKDYFIFSSDQNLNKTKKKPSTEQKHLIHIISLSTLSYPATILNFVLIPHAFQSEFAVIYIISILQT